MGLKEKMMEQMMGKMSKEEKMAMMDKMMDSFFDGITDEDKKEMMNNMMPKMMENMIGNNGGMMGMMRGKMDNSDKGESSNPMNMCQDMISSIKENRKVSTLATPEIQSLFEDWVEQIENEIINFSKDKKSINADDISNEFKISTESAYYFLTRLAQKGKIKVEVGL